MPSGHSLPVSRAYGVGPGMLSTLPWQPCSVAAVAKAAIRSASRLRAPKIAIANRHDFWDAAFVLAVGSFLLTVELFTYSGQFLAFLLTVLAFLLTVLASLLTVGAFLLTVGNCV